MDKREREREREKMSHEASWFRSVYFKRQTLDQTF